MCNVGKQIHVLLRESTKLKTFSGLRLIGLLQERDETKLLTFYKEEIINIGAHKLTNRKTWKSGVLVHS